MTRKLTRREFIRAAAHTAAAAAMGGVVLSSAADAEEVVSTPRICDFTFIHITDEHMTRSDSAATIAELRDPRQIHLAPYDVTAAEPSFVLDTGDLTEFGPIDGAWDALLAAYEDVPIPHYMALGNHDETWGSLRQEFWKLYGRPYYSFDQFGCHFVVLNSAGLQDPRPMIGPEQLEWLERDLKSVGREAPVFAALHHPVGWYEYASPYERNRLLDVLRPYNVVVLLVGHTHRVAYENADGFDMVHGGSAWGHCPPGYSVCCVKDGRLSIAYKEHGKEDAETALLSKSMAPPEKRYLSIAITEPCERSAWRGEVPFEVYTGLAPGDVKRAYVRVDDKHDIELAHGDGSAFTGVAAKGKLAPGAHYAKACFVDRSGHVFHRATCFYVEPEYPKVHWRAFMGAASRSTPAVTEEYVYAGANDGCLRAYDRASGRLAWRVRTGGAVACEPLVTHNRVVFGSGDGVIRCVSAQDGSPVWEFAAGSPIYGACVSDGRSIYFGCTDGSFYSVDADTGDMNWRSGECGYCIESKAFVLYGRVYFGSWDTYIYCLDARDGTLVWKCVGQGSAEGKAPRYYSPADCGPVVIRNTVLAPDRKYRLSLIDAQSGKLMSFVDKVSAVGFSEDGKCAYLRKTDGKLTKTAGDCRQLWSVDVGMDAAPVAPVEVGGVVYVTSQHGLVSAVDASEARIIWQYQATPESYVLSSVNALDGIAYISGTDGSLTAVGG